VGRPCPRAITLPVASCARRRTSPSTCRTVLSRHRHLQFCLRLARSSGELFQNRETAAVAVVGGACLKLGARRMNQPKGCLPPHLTNQIQIGTHDAHLLSFLTFSFLIYPFVVMYSSLPRCKSFLVRSQRHTPCASSNIYVRFSVPVSFTMIAESLKDRPQAKGIQRIWGAEAELFHK
jgi:hypothetical protein